MNRRTFLAAGLASLAVRPAAAQDSAGPAVRAAPGSDRLFRPDAVQQRSEATAADNDAEIQALERRLKCVCGCNLDIYTCRTTDFTCTYSPELHREVLALREAGKTPDQIVDAFVAKHGEQILMAPPAEGFNLAGYLVPGAALLAAGSVLAMVLIRRSRMPAVAAAGGPGAAAGPAGGPARATPGSRDISPDDEELLRQALDEVED
ncbi:MAG TPA: cytochrome c-type biogenesis protein CcmH [Gemmatimonadales bacterium]|nr:cytochrome c-type biogenesis protein CcmH [Gemmatimonadales bacterium]